MLCTLTWVWLAACGGGAPASPEAAQPATGSQADAVEHMATGLVSQGNSDQLWRLHARTASIHSDERLDVVDSLHTVSTEEALAILDILVWDEDFEVREAALEALLDPHMQDIADSSATLTMLMTDADPEVRHTLVEALTDTGGPAALSLLRDATSDPDATVRAAAYDGLRQLEARH